MRSANYTLRSRSRRFSVRVPTVTAMLLGVAVTAVHAQVAELPFGAGERLTYRVSVSKFGSVGEGVMSVEGPVDIRGTSAFVLRSDIHARIGFVKTTERSESWIDPTRMAALRYTKRTRGPLSRGDQHVELYPDDQRWEDQRGRVGQSPTSEPLDELSFIYYLRTLPLDADTVNRVVRHYDRDRNPISVRVLGRDTVRTKAGTFATIIVEMRVKDPQRYGGEGVIRIHLSDDELRYPVRIESSVPVLGATVLTLESFVRPAHRFAGHPDTSRASGEP
jgi:hypothetical protein